MTEELAAELAKTNPRSQYGTVKTQPLVSSAMIIISSLGIYLDFHASFGLLCPEADEACSPCQLFRSLIRDDLEKEYRVKPHRSSLRRMRKHLIFSVISLLQFEKQCISGKTCLDSRPCRKTYQDILGLILIQY